MRYQELFDDQDLQLSLAHARIKPRVPVSGKRIKLPVDQTKFIKMSFSIARTLTSTASRMFSARRAMVMPVGQLRAGVRGLQSLHNSQRGFTRSMWYMCNQTGQQQPQAVLAKTTGWTKTCGCCGLHTEGKNCVTASAAPLSHQGSSI